MENPMNRRYVLASLAALGVGGTFTFTTLTSAQSTEDATGPASTDVSDGTKQITIWRDPGCGCCDTYADYLEENGYQVTRIDDRDFDKRSIEVGVPEQGLGCHLAEIEGYYVSGLVPSEILERLVTEKPDITGITLPGMPSNAPGMARVKTGTLKTYAFGEGGITVYSDE
ncbi:metal-binding protein [Tritonibacter mobilis]|nr:metal-binding protein [Tritonibacter mobilis F1926]KJZ22816.1 metal-binding protein [Tritonibacter mobilis]